MSVYALSVFILNVLPFHTSVGLWAQSVEDSSGILSETDESKLPLVTEDGSYNVSGVQTVNSTGVFVRMLLVLAFIIALIYILFRVLKKKPEVQSAEKDPFLRKVASINVAPGKSVQVVSLVDRAYIIGVGEDSISLIAQVEDKELINAMNLYADKHQNTVRPRNFGDVLDIFMPKKAEPEKNISKDVYDGAAKQILDTLDKQRERLEREDV